MDLEKIFFTYQNQKGSRKRNSIFEDREAAWHHSLPNKELRGVSL